LTKYYRSIRLLYPGAPEIGRFEEKNREKPRRFD